MIACDLGSNTFRVVEIDCQTKQRVKEFEKIVRTAENLAHSGKITDKAVDRVIEAINEAKESFDLSSAKAVATAAMRKASNRDEVLEKILKETGLKIEVIDGKKEAFYVKKAVKEYVDCDFIIMDLGGGSTELILKDEDRSFDIGIVTLVDKYGVKDIDRGIKREFESIREFAHIVKKPETFVATAGTPTTVAAFLYGMDYKSYDYRKINGTVLTISQIESALQQLLKMSEDERINWVGVGRDDLIIAGIMMFIEIVKIFGFEKVMVIDDGLREGLALSYC
jgi:exopolyphosphatase/guanosine-5'-triphosphate,3'-diphosphate pyrophosphatase